MCREGASGSVVFLKIIDDSEEGEVLLEEWDRLTEQECLLEEKLLRLEQAVLEVRTISWQYYAIMASCLLKTYHTIEWSNNS